MTASTLVFVAGATGLTGRFAVASARARGLRTVAHVRPDSPKRAQFQARFEALGAEVDLTPWSRAAFVERFAALRPTLVLALLGTTQARVRAAARAGLDPRAHGYDAVDVGLTRILLDACAPLSPAPRFVYLSSAGVTDAGGNAYLRARAEVERALRASPLPYTIVRPSFIVGERDDPRLSERVGAPLADGLLGLASALGARGALRYRSITGEALGEAVVRLGLDPSWAGRVAEREVLGG